MDEMNMTQVVLHRSLGREWRKLRPVGTGDWQVIMVVMVMVIPRWLFPMT